MIPNDNWNAVPIAAEMLSANDWPTGSKRSHSYGSASPLTPLEPKRPRLHRPEPEYIDLVSDDEDSAVAGDANPRHPAFPPPSGSEAPAAPPPEDAEPVEATVDRLVAEYSRGVPRAIQGKKAKYYVVWDGRRCGIFLSWAECERQVSGFKNAGFKSTKTYDSAKGLLRENLLAKLRQQAREEQCSRPPPQHPTAVSGSAAPSAAASNNAVARGPTDQDLDLPKRPDEFVLCQEQQEAMDLALQGRNLFITGSGGCGKSVLVKALCSKLRAMDKNVHLIAPTGQAALNIGGKTTFSYAGWVPSDMKRPIKELEEKARRKRVFRRLVDTEVLIIDEISMLESQCFDRLSRIMSFVRGESANFETRMDAAKAFGGVQVIAVGDFCQLPPVRPFEHCTQCSKQMAMEMDGRTVIAYSCPDGHGKYEDHEKWAFKSLEWERCHFEYVPLTKIHRQQEGEFVSVLQRCRLGRDLEKAEVDLLLNHPADVTNGVRLFSLTYQVENHNARELAQLPTQETEYLSVDYYTKPEDVPHKELQEYNVGRPPLRTESKFKIAKEVPRSDQQAAQSVRHRYPERLELKVNMPVILLANIDLEGQLCNGSQGVICGFVPHSRFVWPNEPDKKNYKTDPDGFRVAKERYEQIESFMEAEGTPSLLPEVKFHNGRRRVIGPDCTVNEVGPKSPFGLVSRTQIPLAPGWAMTIHKSQSLSLDRVIVDLANVFEKGQAYVALSRARSLSGLKIEGTSDYRLRAGLQLDAEVRKFMDMLEGLKTGPARAETPTLSL